MKRFKRLISSLFISLLMITSLFPSSALGTSIHAAGENSLSVKWTQNASWDSSKWGSGDEKNYTFTNLPSSNGTSIQAEIDIISSTAYPAGSYTFTLNNSLLQYRDKSACPISNFGIEEAADGKTYGANTFFSYKVDPSTGIVTFKNVKEIPANSTKIFTFTYNVAFNAVPNGTVATIEPTNLPNGVTVSPAKLTFHAAKNIAVADKTDTKVGGGVRALPESAVKAGTYYGQDASYYAVGGEGSFKENYYMLFRLRNYNTGNEPRYVTFTDETNTTTVTDTENQVAGKNGVIVGMSTDYNGTTYAKGFNSSKATYTIGEVDVKNNVVTPTPQAEQDSYCYVLVRYPMASNTLKVGQSLIGSDTYTASIKGADTNETISSDPITRSGTWTKYVPESGGGDGSTKTSAQGGNVAGAAAMLRAGYDIPLTYNVNLANWYNTLDSDKKYVQADHTGIAVDDTIMVGSSTYDGYVHLGKNDYSLKSLTISGVKDSSWNVDAHATVVKETSDATLKVYASTELSGDSWEEIKTYNYADVYNKTVSVDEIDGTENYLRFKVELGKVSYRADFTATPTWTIKANRPWIDQVAANDVTSIGLSNSAAFLDVTTDNKLAENEMDKNYANSGSENYLNRWNPSTDTTKTQQMNEILDQDNTTFAKYYDTDRKGNGVPRDWGDCYLSLDPANGNNGTWMDTTSQTNDVANSQVIVSYRQRGAEWYSVTGDSLTQLIDSTGLALERDSATFYHLLPAGQKYVDGSVTATGVVSDVKATATCVPVQNFQGTGRTMLVFSVKADNAGTNTYYPGGGKHPDGSGNSSNGSIVNSGAHLQTGFQIDYQTAVSWNSMNDVSAVYEGGAYMVDGVNMLGTAYPDQMDGGTQKIPGVGDVNVNGVSNIYKNNKKADGYAFNNLAGASDYDPASTNRIKDTIYTNNQTVVTANYSADSGLTKTVMSTSGSNPSIYMNDTDVEINTDYSYRLQYNNSAYISTDTMVLYDNFEAAGDTGSSWKGTFKGIDTSIAESKGIAPKIYYSKSSNPSVDVNDGSWTLWETYENGAYTVNDQTDPASFKALAIDLTYNQDGSKFSLSKLSQISCVLMFTAPQSKELDDAVNTAAQKSGNNTAKNAAGASLIYHVSPTDTTGTIATVGDAKKFTTVDLLDNRVAVNVSKTDEATKAALIGGAEFKLEAKLSDGSWTAIPATPNDGDVRSHADGSAAINGVEIGDLVFENSNYSPSSSAKETPLKVYPEDWVYSQNGANIVKYTGEYRLTETKAPSGYGLNENASYIMVTSQKSANEAVEIPVTNADVKIYTDEAMTQEAKKVNPNDATSNSRFEDPLPTVSVDKVIAKNSDGTDAIDFNSGKVTYSLTVINNGTVPVVGYQFTDTAKNLTYVSHTPSYVAADTTADPAVAESGVRYDNGTFYLADELKPGKENSIKIDVTYTINDVKAGIANKVSAKDRTLDKTRVSSSDDMTPASDGVYKEETVYYLITAGNSSEKDLNEIITDTPSVGLKLIKGTTESGAAVINGDGTITWTTDKISAGENATMLVEAIVTGESEGKTVTNTATDTVNTAIVTDPITEISLAKSTEINEVKIGSDVTYTITLTNANNVNVSDYQFKENPSGLTLKDYSSDSALAYDEESSTFTVGTIGAGTEDHPTSVEVKLVYTINKIPFENEAGISPTPNDDISLSKVRVKSSSDMTPANGSVFAGQTVTYLITVKNDNKDENAYARTFTDKANDNLTLMSVKTESGNAILNEDGTITWKAPEIAADNKITMLVNALVKPKSKGTAINTVFDDMHSAVTVDDISEDAIPDVSVDKAIAKNEDGSDAVDFLKGTVKYTLTVTNRGNESITGYQFTDEASNLTYVSYSTKSDVEYDNGIFTLNDELKPGEENAVTLNVTYSIKNTEAGISNRTETNRRTLDKVRVTSADDMTPAADGVYKEETVYYLITAGNTGKTDLNEVIKDSASDGLKLIKASTKSGSAIINADGTITWTTGKIAAGDSATMLVEAVVTEESDSQTVTNTATDTFNTAVVTDPIAKIELDKSMSTNAAKIGDTVDFTISLKNSSNVNISNYKFNENPTGLKLKDYSSDTANLSYDNDTNTFTVDKISAAKNAQNPTVVDVKVSFTVTQVPFENAAGITPVADDNIQLRKTRVNSVSDLTPAEGGVFAGQTVVYLITVSNLSSTETAYARTFTDKAIKNLVLTAVETKNGTAALNSDGTITWNMPELQKSGKMTMLVTGKVMTGSTGTAVNTVSDGMHTAVAVDAIASVEVTKTVDKTAATIGDNITYTITVSNPTDIDVKNVFVSDDLNNAVKFVNCDMKPFEIDKQSYTWKVDVDAQKSVSIHITVNAIDSGSIKNIAIAYPSKPDDKNKPDDTVIIDKGTSEETKISAPSVNTGDRTNIYFWNGIMMLAIACAAGMFAFKKKASR
jgi:uncharacterized repeat protein (TIGR01451 family)